VVKLPGANPSASGNASAANRPTTDQKVRPEKDVNSREVQRELETMGVFFWYQRGRKPAGSSLSIKTCRLQIIIAFMERGSRRRWEAEIKDKLRTIHPNPGPRDKTAEGKERTSLRRRQTREEKREGRRERREAKRANRLNTSQQNIQEFFTIATWNVQRMSLGTMNKRKAKSVAQYAIKNNWDAILLSEVKAQQGGIFWFGLDENLTAVVYSNRAAILLRGKLLKDWSDGGLVTKRSERSISIKAQDIVLTATYLPVWTGQNDAEIEIAKDNLKDHVNWAKKEDILLVGGDFNAHVGANEERPGVCGIFGLRTTNRQGEELLDWCEENNLSYVNSFYQQKRRGTWFNMALRRWYELDGFIMKNSQRHKLVKKVSLDNEISLSDHKPKIIKLLIPKPKKFKRRRENKYQRFNLRGLKTTSLKRDTGTESKN
jgi:exonuclease III